MEYTIHGKESVREITLIDFPIKCRNLTDWGAQYENECDFLFFNPYSKYIQKSFPSTSPLTAPHKRLCVSINQQQKRETWQSIDNIKLQYFCSVRYFLVWYWTEIKNLFFSYIVHYVASCFGCVKILIWVNVYICAVLEYHKYVFFFILFFPVNLFSICLQGRYKTFGDNQFIFIHITFIWFFFWFWFLWGFFCVKKWFNKNQ